jgi:hypothetical protein
MKVFVTCVNIKMNAFEQLVLTVAKGVLQTDHRIGNITEDKEMCISLASGFIHLNLTNLGLSANYIGKEIVKIVQPFSFGVPLTVTSNGNSVYISWQRFEVVQEKVNISYTTAKFIEK